MQKTYILLAILLGCLLHSQIKMKINLIGLEKTTNGPSYKIQVNLKNTTDDFFAIPVVLTKLKGYFEGDRCVDNLNFTEIKNLDVTAVLKSSGNIMEAYNSPFPQYSMEDLLAMQKENKIANSIKQNNLRRWMCEHNISDIKFAEMNKTLSENIVLLNPKEEISWSIFFRPSSLDCLDCDLYFFYMLKEDSDLDFALLHCVDDSIYTYLTEDQKSKLSGYKLYSGELLSNEIKIHYNSMTVPD
ncbi:hypothetical protein [Chryseobacterium sp.]|uniref:hypothetical protein n=1 Tax=Chryseobacterium sp. TaxID=1871047 RepID=UPI0012A844FF|nr:hypothetical protein [Chryseobacterium sp.]QFG53510.1 hypothetical protein F7R58_08100 [Chryseobacterium sp.]